MATDHRALVAGVDCSTQGTKVILVDPDRGEVVATGRAQHEVTGSGGARETDPEQWWSALRVALAETGRAADVAAISVAGQQHGLVTLGSDGRPLRPAPLWNDTRSAPDAARLVQACDAAWWSENVGLVPVASFTVAKWAWLRRVEPTVAKATVAIRLPHDYVTGRLTGEGVTDRSDVSGTGWWSNRDETYSKDVLALDAAGLDASLLPRVLGPGESAGRVRPSAAADLGLRTGTVVGPGMGDNAGAALGLGTGVGQPVISLGTSGTAYTVSDLRAKDPSGIVAGFADAAGRFLPLACTLNCTLAVDRVAGWLSLDRDAVPERSSVVVIPFLDGERTPNFPAAAGLIAGLRHATSPGEILLATYEGAIVSLLEALEHIEQQSSGLDSTAPLVLTGGGARGRTWQHVVLRLSGRSVLLPDVTESVAMGAALQAASVLTGRLHEEVVEGWALRRGRLLEPVPRDDETLARIARVRAGAHDLLSG
jgi:xylulokinase